MIFDTHCHLDLYPDPQGVAESCEAQRIYTIAVTNAPSVFPKTRDIASGRNYIQAAVGLHPELAVRRKAELPQMWKALEETRYVGEVGLDYVSVSSSDRSIQRSIFSEILSRCDAIGGRILTVHSRRAAEDAVDAVDESFNGRVILHWFSGGVRVSRRAVAKGCYFSVNATMANSRRFPALMNELPIERLLLESDGPFVKVGRRPAGPADGWKVVEAISRQKGLSIEQTAELLLGNFSRVLAHGLAEGHQKESASPPAEGF